MQLSDLSEETIAKVESVRWDRIIEKHEGPEDWKSVLRWYEPEFLTIEGRSVLLPVEKSHHPNITVLRSIWSADDSSVTLFFKDTTYDDHWSMAGFMAVCDKLAGENFYLAIVYHEWFIIEQSPGFES